jgi:serine/threonine protein kinase
MALQCATLEQQSLPIVPQISCGKLPYMSPEVVREDPLDFGVDVYSLGCTLFFIWTGGKLLYEHPSDNCFTFFIRQNGILEAPHVDLDMWLSVPGLPMDWNPLLEKLPLVQDLSDNQRDLLAHMLHIDPVERLTVPEILQHAYLQ